MQAWRCLLHLITHKVAAPVLVRLLSVHGSWLPPGLVPVWQGGLGQMPPPHLMWRVPSLLQQQEILEHRVAPMGYIDGEELVLTGVPASRV